MSEQEVECQSGLWVKSTLISHHNDRSTMDSNVALSLSFVAAVVVLIFISSSCEKDCIARKFCLEEICTFFTPCSLGYILFHEYFVHLNYYTEPMVIFTAWAKIYSAKYISNARDAELGEIFVQ